MDEAKGDELSPEELEQIQKEHEEKLAQTRAEKEAEAARQVQLHAQAGEGYAKRADVIAEARDAQREVDRMQAERIEEKLAQTERLKESEAAKALEIAEVSHEFDGIQERLAKLEQLIEGKNPEDIAPAVAKAIEAATLRADSIRSKKATLDSEIQGLGAAQVSDEQVNRYRGLVESIDGLKAQLGEIDANPALMELLIEEAGNENRVRDWIVERAINVSLYFGRGEKIYDDFIKEVVQRYLTEEIEKAGFNSDNDSQSRRTKLNEFASNVRHGLSKDYEDLKRNHDKSDVDRTNDGNKIGFILRCLVDGFGTRNGLASFIGGVYPNFEGGLYPGGLPSFVRTHFDTVNFMRAFQEGMREHRSVINPDQTGWDYFDREVRQSGNVKRDRGDVLVPADASRADTEIAIKKFTEIKKLAQEKDKELTTRDSERKIAQEAEKEARLGEIDNEIAEINTLLEESKRIEQFLRSRPQRVTYISRFQGYPSQEEAKGTVEEVEMTERELQKVRQQLEEEENKLRKTPSWNPLRRGERREIEVEIRKLRQYLQIWETSLGISRQVMAAKDHIEKHGQSHKIESKRWEKFNEKDRLQRGY